MKAAVALLLASAFVALAIAPPPMPGTVTKKKPTLLSPKAAGAVSGKRMAKAAKALAVTAPVTQVSMVTAVWVDTDGTNILGTTQAVGYKFISPNPLGYHYTISAAPDLNSPWTVLRTGTGDDPLVVYDFTHLTQGQNFYKFTVDSFP